MIKWSENIRNILPMLKWNGGNYGCILHDSFSFEDFRCLLSVLNNECNANLYSAQSIIIRTYNLHLALFICALRLSTDYTHNSLYANYKVNPNVIFPLVEIEISKMLLDWLWWGFIWFILSVLNCVQSYKNFLMVFRRKRRI